MAEDLKKKDPLDDNEREACPACSAALDRLEAAFQAWAEQTGDLHPDSGQPETPAEAVLHNRVWGLLYLHRLLTRDNVDAALHVADTAQRQAGRALFLQAIRDACGPAQVIAPVPERKM